MTPKRVKRIYRKSKLDNLVDGETLELVGITSRSQEDRGTVRGTVLFYDSNGLVIIGRRVSRRTVASEIYAFNPELNKVEHIKTFKYTQNSPYEAKRKSYSRINKKLKEAGIK